MVPGFNSLQDFTSYIESQGEIRRVTAEVDPELEITEIADRSVKAGGPALLFENVRGSEFPLLINAFAGEKRMAWALGVEDVEDAAAKVARLLSPEIPEGLGGRLAKLWDLIKLGKYVPKKVDSAPCQEVVATESFSLFDLPVIKCWPEDAGRFITLPLVITKNPDTGRQNVGMYRLQLFDERTTGMHWHVHHDGAANYRLSQARGEPLEVAVALGGDPATIFAATAPLPREIDELMLAGYLRGRAVEVVPAKTVDLMVPAHAEFVLEGYVPPDELRREGPFGDHTGYYSLAGDYPVFHVTAITRRSEPLYPTTIVGRPPMEDCFMAKATERIFLPVLRAVVPEIVDMDMPWEGVFHNCVIVSIRKEFPRHANKVMHALWGLGQMMFAKTIVVVDADVNVHDYSEVTWRVFNNVDARRDLVITEGPLDVLDHSSPQADYGAKLGIDATRKISGEGHDREWPHDILMDPEVKRRVDERWSEYGLG